MESHYNGSIFPKSSQDTPQCTPDSTKPYHHQVQRRGISITLAEFFVALLLMWLFSFTGGYWLSREHSNSFHGPAYNKVRAEHTILMEEFVKLEVRIGLLEGKGQRKGWR